MPNSEPRAPADATSWRFADLELDGRRRTLTRAGVPVHLRPLAFDLLLHLVRHHRRTVSRAELIAHCWGERDVTEGVVARILVSLRNALGDADPQRGWIQTVPRVGYRFVAPVRALAAGPTHSKPGSTVRLAVLPVDNRSADPQLAWVELGLASLIGDGLATLQVGGIAGVRRALVVLQAVPPAARADTARCARLVAHALGAQAVLASRFEQQHGRCMLHLALHRDGAPWQQGIVLADDLGDLPPRAAALVARWLAPAEGAAALDLGDAFLNEVWQRVLRCGRDDSLLEAEHLLEVLRDAGADAPEVRLEQARIALRLGRPPAAQAPPRIEAGAARQHDAAAGPADDARARLAQALRAAERSGDRLLLRDACDALGQAAALDEDWEGALRHHAMGLTMAQTLHDAARAAPLCGLSQARLQLGLLREAETAGVEALRCARLTGAQPAPGQAAMALAEALRARRRTGALRELLSSLDALADDPSVAMQVARESCCRASLLRLAGQHDAALACIAQARHVSRRHPLLAAICVRDRLQVLLAARRFDAVQALCRPLVAARTGCLDARLVPWLELAVACCEHALHADPAIALRRLETLLARGGRSHAHAMAALAAAWIDLDAGRATQAATRVAALGTWLEQSPAGRLVAVRSGHLARGGDAGVSERLLDAGAGFERHRELGRRAHQGDQAGGADVAARQGGGRGAHFVGHGGDDFRHVLGEAGDGICQVVLL